MSFISQFFYRNRQNKGPCFFVIFTEGQSFYVFCVLNLRYLIRISILTHYKTCFLFQRFRIDSWPQNWVSWLTISCFTQPLHLKSTTSQNGHGLFSKHPFRFAFPVTLPYDSVGLKCIGWRRDDWHISELLPVRVVRVWVCNNTARKGGIDAILKQV